MVITLLKPSFLVFALATFLFGAADTAGAQDHTRRLHSPAVASGLIGGESHDSYVIRVRKDQRMTVQISWRHEHDPETGENRAEFFVGELPNFNGDGEVKFGRTSDNGQRWSGKIPRTGDYYIYVMAHPSAHYTLKATLE
jgi:hypothetical protein